MTVWSDHQASIGKKLTCPLCRNDWARGAPAAAAAAPASAAARAAAGGPVHRHARCRSCRASPLYGRRCRCLLCPDRLELCEDCFETGMHPNHNPNPAPTPTPNHCFETGMHRQHHCYYTPALHCSYNANTTSGPSPVHSTLLL